MAEQAAFSNRQTVVPAARAFLRELAPSYIDNVCLTSGFAPPPGSPIGEGMGAGFSYCELHCGSAVTATLLAASNPAGEFHAIDPRKPPSISARAFAAEGAVRNTLFTKPVSKHRWPWTSDPSTT